MKKYKPFFNEIAEKFYEECYSKIKSLINLNFEKDEFTRDELQHFLNESGYKPSSKNLKCSNSTALLFTPGPTLDENFSIIFKKNHIEHKFTIIAVDGAARKFLDAEVPTDMVVTDLDGLSLDEISYMQQEWHTIFFIHAHGDNIEKIHDFSEKMALTNDFIFTTQSVPSEDTYNFGGFTDGDRAAFIATALGFHKILLVSMDLDSNIIGKYSKPDNEKSIPVSSMPLKKKKMKIGLSCLKWLNNHKPDNTRIFTFKKVPALDFIPNLNKCEFISS